jgi:hypothetical protein
MKETNFRALRREEKRKAYERKRARLQAVRAKALEEKQKKDRERKQDSEEPGFAMPDTFVGRFEFVRRGGIVYTDSKLLKDNIIKGHIKRKQGEALLSRLDEAFKSYASVIFDRQQLVDEALAKLAEIQKEIDLVF